MDRFADWEYPIIEHNKLTRWNWTVSYPENLEIGKFVDIGAFTYIQALHGVTIGEWVQIGSHTSIYSWDSEDGKIGHVIIREKAKIGTHCSIHPGVTIGKGAVVGAHSMIKCDVPDNAIYAGRPAEPLYNHKIWKEYVESKK